MRYQKNVHLMCVVVLIAAVSGCNTVKAPVSYQGEWTIPQWEKNAVKPDKQWQQIRTDPYDTSKPLTPAQLIDIALANNPDTQKIWNDARAAEARMWQSRGAW